MRLYGNKFYISVGDLKVLRKLLKEWDLDGSYLYQEFELLNLNGYHDSDTVIYDWKKGSVKLIRKNGEFYG